MVAMLITVPLTLGYLGSERFGMWMTISSLITIFAFADLGIGNGLLSAIADATGKNDQNAVRGLISSGIFVLSLIGAALLLIFGVAYPLISWSRVFNVASEPAIREVGPAMIAFVGCVALGIPLSAVTQAQKGLQAGFVVNLWQCFGSVVGLCCVVLAIHLEAGLPWLILALTGAPLLVTALNGVIYFGFVAHDLRPSFASVSSAAVRKISYTGLLFFVLQFTFAISYASDNMVIAQFLGPQAVTEYAVPEKMFNIVIIALTMVLAPLWPAYGEAVARGDMPWVRKTLFRSVTIAFVFAVACAVPLVVFGKEIISLWVDQRVIPPMVLLLGFGLWKITEAVGTALAVFLNGINVVRLQVVISILTAIGAITLKIVLVPMIGIAGAVWASLISYFLFALLPYLFLLPRILRERVAVPV